MKLTIQHQHSFQKGVQVKNTALETLKDSSQQTAFADSCWTSSTTQKNWQLRLCYWNEGQCHLSAFRAKVHFRELSDLSDIALCYKLIDCTKWKKKKKKKNVLNYVYDFA